MTVCAPPERLATPARTETAHSAGLKILFLLCLASGLLGRLSYIVRPLDADGAMFIYMGKLVANGGRIGIELIDNKFPTVGLLTSPCWKLFGDFWPGYVLLQAALSLTGAAVLGRAARRTIGKQAAFPTALFALVYLNFNFAVFGGFQLETLQIFFSILAAAAALEALATDDLRDTFLIGLAAGVAAMIKPSGGAVLAAFFIALLFHRRRFAEHLVAAVGGLLIPAAGTFAYLWAADLLPIMPSLYRQIAGYAANSPWEPWDLSKPVIVLLILGFPLLIRLFVFRRPQHRARAGGNRAIVIFIVAWLVLEAAGIVAQRRMYAYHFLPLAAPASLLFGLIPRTPRPSSLAAALLLPAALSFFGGAQVLAHASESLEQSASENYLATHAAPGDGVWLDGMMRLLVRTDLSPGSRYPMTFLWVNDDDAPLRYCRAMLDDFDARRPKYIVLPTRFDHYVHALSDHIKELGLRPRRKANFIAAWMMLGDYVHHHYHAQTEAGWETIYVRNP